MEYFAIVDTANPDAALNVFIVNREPEALDLLVFDHTQHRWVQHDGLLKYLFGDAQNERREITQAAARQLLDAWGAVLPSAADLETARRGDGDG